ncbi:DUF309 domain-containing protein [Evansella sp. AB-P1]|uniref:DUF309 domain-containing protein n=1 Tax=Evansella sp. AB-P1 TaxID=3037653 RepID=UPI00241DD93F|nr:DUF309 domain-containing protein [Evansella sp. AB-P1]MDG5787664.1 DUF309 domain-containing protein [Evansella sp. AB-P1]
MKHYPKAYIEYLLHFHGTRDYFECHEIMEEYWKETGFQKHWLALIQLAVATYHERQGNIKGSLRMFQKVLAYLQVDKVALSQIGIDVGTLESIVNKRLNNLKKGGPYEPLNIPLADKDLIDLCKKQCGEQNLTWCYVEDMEDKSLIFRHKLRDRTDVIHERLSSLKQKERERKG